jgi:hypothetical protein
MFGRMSTQPVSIRDFPADLYKRIKLEAVKREVTVREMFIDALRRYLEQRGQK